MSNRPLERDVMYHNLVDPTPKIIEHLSQIQDEVEVVSETLITESNGVSITDTLGTNVHELQYSADFPLIKQTGVKIVRESILWDKVETVKGQYNFTPSGINYDTFIQNMTDNDIRPYMILMPSNTLYTTALNSSLDDDTKRTAFANFAGATAAHFKNKNIIWEIYNEPNGSWAWTPQTNGAFHYTELVKKTAPKIKQNDPTAFVVAPALFGPESFTNTGNIPYGLTWLEETFKNGILEYIDAVSVHPYRDVNPETVIADYKKIRTLIKTYSNRDIPIVCGEWGYSSTPNWNGTGSSAIVPDELTQAQYVARMLLINSYQSIPITIYYDWKNDGQSTSAVESNFGLMKYDQVTQKQAATAYQTLAQTLRGYYFTERVDTGSESDYVLKYVNAKSEIVYAYWTTGSDHDFSLATDDYVSGKYVTMLGSSTALSSTVNPTLSLKKSPSYLLIDGKQPVKVATLQRVRDAVNQAQDFLKDWVSNTFVEDNSKTVTLADLDSLVKRGEYRITDGTNSYWGGVIVFGRDPSATDATAEVGQIRFKTGTSRLWEYRSCTVSNGVRTWQAWEKIVKSSDLNAFTWTTPATFLNGATVNSGESFQHTKLVTGVVYLQGAVNVPTTGTGVNTKIYTLPSGSRPTRTRYIRNDVGKFRIDVNGDITVLDTTQTFFTIVDSFLGV